jgi:hypothetical protein
MTFTQCFTCDRQCVVWCLNLSSVRVEAFWISILQLILVSYPPYVQNVVVSFDMETCHT